MNLVGGCVAQVDYDSELLIDADYTLLQRLERFVYIGDDRHIAARYCQGRFIDEPKI